MDPQQQLSQQQQKVEHVAHQIFKAMNQQNNQFESNIITFLNKLYKNNSSIKPKKMKSIRLNRFINLLELMISDFVKEKDDVDILYNSIVSVILNDKNFSDQEDDQLVETLAKQFAKIIEMMTTKLSDTQQMKKQQKSQIAQMVIKLLLYLIKGQNLSQSLTLNQFDNKIKKSTYFQNLSLQNNSKDLVSVIYGSNQRFSLSNPSSNISSIPMLQHSNIKNVLLTQLNIQAIYSNLFKFVNPQEKFKIIQLFYSHVKKIQALQQSSKLLSSGSSSKSHQQSRKHLFIQTFIQPFPHLTIQQTQSILKILQKPIFQRQAINEIITKISQQKISLKQLIKINFKNMKGIEEVFIQSILQQIKKQNIYQLIDNFLYQMTNQKYNYFPLYLILKMGKKVPIEYVDLLFGQQKRQCNNEKQKDSGKDQAKQVAQNNSTFTIRKAIIFVLAIIQNQQFTQSQQQKIQKAPLTSSFSYILQSFAKWNKQHSAKTNKKTYTCILRAIHFSLQNISKATIISTILKFIHKQDLNKQTHLEFINYNPLKIKTFQEMKKMLNQNKRQSLNELFSILNEFDKISGNELSAIKSNSSQVNEKRSLSQQNSSILSLQSKIKSSLIVSQAEQKQNLMNQQIQHKMKLDLQFITHTNPSIQGELLTTIKQLNDLLTPSNKSNQSNSTATTSLLNTTQTITTSNMASLQQILMKLPNLKQNLLQVVLMFINNKYDTFYSQENTNITLEWALKVYKKYTTELETELKTILEKEKMGKYEKLVKVLIQYGMESKVELKFGSSKANLKQKTSLMVDQIEQNPHTTKLFTPQIQHIINSSNLPNQRMNTDNFNDYFLTKSKYKSYITSKHSSTPTKTKQSQSLYHKISWLKILLNQLKQLIKNMIKAQKVGNRKQIKTIITDNVSDILAFKVIHEYCDAQIQSPEGKCMLLQIFYSIQPSYEYFDRVQKLAQSVNMEFYQLYSEIPHLLEQFNSDALNFLSKLIVSNSANQKGTNLAGNNANQQQGKKKNKKNKNETNNTPTLPQDCTKCIDTIIKHIHLLFTCPNNILSYKHIYTILKKIIQTDKITKQQLSPYINKWFSQINYITCSGNNFAQWKQKILSITKIWKSITDLFWGQKILQTKVIEKHFSLFTDSLNKLYENFRNQTEFLEIQQKILLTLCLIYKQLEWNQGNQEDNYIQIKELMNQGNNSTNINFDMTEFIIKKFQEKNQSVLMLNNKYYYCYECKKNSCYACASFLHRNHDKIFMGKNGTCQHQSSLTDKTKVKKQQPLQVTKTLIKQSSSLFGGVSALLKNTQDLPQQLVQRIHQKFLYEKHLEKVAQQQFTFFSQLKQQQRDMIDRQFSRGRGGDKYDKYDKEKRNQLRKKIKEKEQLVQKYNQKMNKINNGSNQSNQYLLSQQNKQSNSYQNDHQIIAFLSSLSSDTIIPQSQEYFQYKQPYCQQFKKIQLSLNRNIIPKMNLVNPKINCSPLAKVFIRQLCNQTFYYNQDNKTLQGQNIKDNNQTEIKMTEIKQKYGFFKNVNLIAKDNQQRNIDSRNRNTYGISSNSNYNPGNSIYQPNMGGLNPQQGIKTASYRRNIITCSSKFLFYPSNLCVFSFSIHSILLKLHKKIQNKQYLMLEQQKNYQNFPPISNLPFEINECSFSKSASYPMLACVGYNQICFYPIQPDGRLSRQINPEFHRLDPIIKFQWINPQKNLFAIGYQTYIRIGGVSPSNTIKTFAKITSNSNRQIKAFDGYMNSKMYVIYFIDTQGKVYFVDVDFNKDKELNPNRQGSGHGRNTILTHSQTHPNEKLLNLVDQKGKKIQNVYSIKCIGNNRLLLSCNHGVIRLTQARCPNTFTSTSPVKTYGIDISKALKIQNKVVLDSLNILKNSQETILISGITRKLTQSQNQPRRPCGSLMIININLTTLCQNKQPSNSTQLTTTKLSSSSQPSSNPQQTQIFYIKQQTIQSYDITQINSTTLAFIYSTQQGLVYLFKYHLYTQKQQIVERPKILINNSVTQMLRDWNKQFCEKKVFGKISEGGMVKNYQFKENKVITTGYSVSTKEKGVIDVGQLMYCSTFITGIAFTIELPSALMDELAQNQNMENQIYLESNPSQDSNNKKPSQNDHLLQLKLSILNCTYKFTCSSKTRQIQLPFNIKQTLQLFVTKQNKIKIQYEYKINEKILKLNKFSQKQLQQFMKIKNLNVYGYDAKDLVTACTSNQMSPTTSNDSQALIQSIYHIAYKQLLNDWLIYEQYPKQSLEQYWLNPYRSDFYNLQMKRLYKLNKYDQLTNQTVLHICSNQPSSEHVNGFKMSEINLFLKLELFTQTVPQCLLLDSQKSMKNNKYTTSNNKEEIKEYLNLIKKYLLSKNYRRKSLENSVLRLSNTLCTIYEQQDLFLQKNLIRQQNKQHLQTHQKIFPGHPYHQTSLLNFFEFNKLYKRFKQKRTFQNYEKLLQKLSSLVFYQGVDLWIVLEMEPEIIIELSTYFNLLIKEKRSKQNNNNMFSAQNSLIQQSSLTRLCSKFISIICEFYQVMKNKNIEKSQEKMLNLLQQVFGITNHSTSASKLLSPTISSYTDLKHPATSTNTKMNQATKQIIMNPFIYLESIFNSEQFQYLSSSVDLFNLCNKINQIDFSSLKTQNNTNGKKNNKKESQLISQNDPNKVSSLQKQQLQPILNANQRRSRNWQSNIEQEKQLDQQEQQMYKNVMDIQQEYEQFENNLMGEEQQDLDEQQFIMMQQVDDDNMTRRQRLLEIRERRILGANEQRNLRRIENNQANNNINNVRVESIIEQEFNNKNNSQMNLELGEQSYIGENKANNQEQKQDLDEVFTKNLLQKTVSPFKRLTITHFDFSLKLAIALFKKQNYLTLQNAYFYLGLLYNLLKIIQDNFLKHSITKQQNKKKIFQLIEQIDKKLQCPEYSCLWIVVNFFVSPRYSSNSQNKQNKNYRSITNSQSKLAEYFIDYYKQHFPRFIYLLTQYKPKTYPQSQQITKLADIIRFEPFQLKNELYSLKLIANIYLGMRLNMSSFNQYLYSIPQYANQADTIYNQVKQSILFKMVQFNKIPTLKNIVLYEKWNNQIDRVKILVNFEIVVNSLQQLSSLNQQPSLTKIQQQNKPEIAPKSKQLLTKQLQKGIFILYECAKTTPESYIKQMMSDENKVNLLQQLLLKSNEELENNGLVKIQLIRKKVVDLLDVYYKC